MSYIAIAAPIEADMLAKRGYRCKNLDLFFQLMDYAALLRKFLVFNAKCAVIRANLDPHGSN